MEHELAHYGVKGMKWGVRKERKQSTSKKEYVPDPDAYRTYEPRYLGYSNRQIGEAVLVVAVSALSVYALSKATQKVGKKVGKIVDSVGSASVKKPTPKAKKFKDMGAYVTEIMSDGSVKIKNSKLEG